MFDHDQLHDYRSRRPAMIFDTNQWKSYADLHLRIYRVTDGHGEVFLLFSGPEPDVQWERLAAAVVGLIEQLGVRMTVGVHGIPMAVPHTRPITLTAHATDAVADQGLSKLDRPCGGARQLYWPVGVSPRPARSQGDGFAAHVPHYLAQASFPQATLTLTRSLNQATGLAVPLEPLGEGVCQQPRQTSLRRWRHRQRFRSSWRPWSSSTMRSRLNDRIGCPVRRKSPPSSSSSSLSARRTTDLLLPGRTRS